MNKVISILLLTALAAPAQARMYQWIDPDTGTTQLSGKPPAWYRSGAEGPRVFVFENGRVIDDTGIALPEGETERLRQEALLQAEKDRAAALEKLLQARRQKAAMALAEDDGEVVVETPVAQAPAPSADASPGGPDAAGPTAEELRALIEQYELMRTLNARQVVEETEAAAPPAE